MPHQEEGIAFLLEKQCGLLAFEQGLGKTLVAIKAFARLRHQGHVDALLVICPNSLKRNWNAEIVRFEPDLDIQIVEGTARMRRLALAKSRKTITIMSYETARSEITSILAFLGRRRFVLVLDESHAVKNRYSLTSTAARHFAQSCPYRWLLSGTPITNTAADLYAQVTIIAGGKKPLGSFESFVASNSEEEGLESLRAQVAPFVLRRSKDDCLNLPNKLFVDTKVELPQWQRKLYDSMRDKLVCEIETMSGEEFKAYAPTALAKLLRLSQIASNPGLLLPTEPRSPAKFIELDYLVNEIVSGENEKLIIWSHYVQTIEALQKRYQELGCVSIYGKIPAPERQDIANSFQRNPNIRILIGNPAAAGTGFTLTASRFAIYETLSWRFDFYAQSQDRIHRIGQDRPVTYIRLIATGTIEEVICEALQRKLELARVLLGDRPNSSAITTLTPKLFCQMLVENRLPDDC